MKMNLDMSFEEGLNVVNALRECAIENGWDEDELDESGVIEEYTSAVDAALTAMGISVSIASEPEVEDDDDSDDEEWDEDEEGGYFNSDDEDEDEEDECLYSLTPKGEFVLKALEAGIAFEDACNIANFLFDNGEGE